MNAPITFTQLLECVADVLDTDTNHVTDATPMAELEAWDSVNALRVLTALEASFGVRLKVDTFVRATTFGELERLLTGAMRKSA